MIRERIDFRRKILSLNSSYKISVKYEILFDRLGLVKKIIHETFCPMDTEKMSSLNDSLSDLITAYLWSVECTTIKHSCDLYKIEYYINISKNKTSFFKKSVSLLLLVNDIKQSCDKKSFQS